MKIFFIFLLIFLFLNFFIKKFLIKIILINKDISFSKLKFFKKIINLNILLFILINFFSLFFSFICFFNRLIINFIFSFIFYFLIFLYRPYKIVYLLIHFSIKRIPLILIFFLIIIEFLRFFIKPSTLIIRLSTNLITGHLILEFISSLIFFLNLIINFFLFVLEIIVGIIQGLVFNLILILYSKE